jgi:hypothetical protein
MPWVLILMGILFLVTVRIATRKRRNARQVHRAARRRARVHHGMSRTVRTRGVTLGSAKVCADPKCGLPASRCRHLLRQAEHAEGMLGELD